MNHLRKARSHDIMACLRSVSEEPLVPGKIERRVMQRIQTQEENQQRLELGFVRDYYTSTSKEATQ